MTGDQLVAVLALSNVMVGLRLSGLRLIEYYSEIQTRRRVSSDYRLQIATCRCRSESRPV